MTKKICPQRGLEFNEKILFIKKNVEQSQNERGKIKQNLFRKFYKCNIGQLSGNNVKYGLI